MQIPRTAATLLSLIEILPRIGGRRRIPVCWPLVECFPQLHGRPVLPERVGEFWLLRHRRVRFVRRGEAEGGCEPVSAPADRFDQTTVDLVVLGIVEPCVRSVRDRSVMPSRAVRRRLTGLMDADDVRDWAGDVRFPGLLPCRGVRAVKGGRHEVDRHCGAAKVTLSPPTIFPTSLGSWRFRNHIAAAY